MGAERLPASKSSLLFQCRPGEVIPDKGVGVCGANLACAHRHMLAAFNKVGAEYTFIRQFFQKEQFFWKNYEKLSWGAYLIIFKERRRLASKINVTSFLSKIRYWIFYEQFFQKKVVFFEKMATNCFGSHGLATKMNISFFIGNQISNIFSFNSFFEKRNIYFFV